MRCRAFLTLFILSLLSSFAPAQTVTADFGLRALTTKRIPADMFGINLASLQNPATLTSLKGGGITLTRKM